VWPEPEVGPTCSLSRSRAAPSRGRGVVGVRLGMPTAGLAGPGAPGCWFSNQQRIPTRTRKKRRMPVVSRLRARQHALECLLGLAGMYLIREARHRSCRHPIRAFPVATIEQEAPIADGAVSIPRAKDLVPGRHTARPIHRHQRSAAQSGGITAFWIPEVFGEVMVVNGKSWPFFSESSRVANRFPRGQFRPNARFLRCRLMSKSEGQTVGQTLGPAFGRFGLDGGFRNAPTKRWMLLPAQHPSSPAETRRR